MRTPEYLELVAMGQAATRAWRVQQSRPEAAGAEAPAAVPAGPPNLASTALVVRGPLEASVLAVVGGQWSAVDLTSLRRVIRQVSRACRDRDAETCRDMATWMLHPAPRFEAAFGSDAPCSLARLPSHIPFYSSTRWCPPAIQVAERVMRAAGPPRSGPPPSESGDQSWAFSGCTIHNALRSWWTRQHPVVEHHAVPQLGTVLPSRLTASPCRHLGMCLCTEDKADLKTFRLSLIGLLQAYLKKEKGNKHKPLFESARGVLRLDWYNPEADVANELPTKTRWYHLSTINQNSWSVAFVELYLDKDPQRVRIATAIGHVALRAAPFGTNLDFAEDVWEPQRVFHAWRLENAPCIFAFEDFSLKCTCSIYEIVEDDRIVDEFVPYCVEVFEWSHDPVLIWPAAAPALKKAAAERAPRNVVSAGQQGCSPTAR
jgi:hypothetical protein